MLATLLLHLAMQSKSKLKDKNILEDLDKIDTDNNSLDTLLNFKILTVNDYTLTPGILILVLLLLILVWLLRISIKRILIGARTEDNVEYGRRYSVYMIAKYLIFLVTFVVVLQMVGISLNALMVGSAALLVGVGLGLQHIFQDLVSGLFLLFERPIEIGDIIEVDNIVGKIQIIRLRHTVVLDRDGVNLIVPNHKFITEKVINWSHNIEERRFMVSVGVDYSSEPMVVSRILKGVAKENSFVIKNNALYSSFVRFADFGDSALMFELYFWTRHSFIVENIKSDLRFKIHEEFKKAGVKIPFPQRDLHIKSGSL